MENKVVLCDPCLFVETEAKASGFCEKCVEYLCVGCINEHKKGKMTRNHKVQEEIMPQNADIIKAMNEMRVCQFHKEMNVTYRCNDHGVCVCAICRVDEHRKCEDVFEFAKSEHADADLKGTLLKFTEIEEAAASIRSRKEDNKTSLCQTQDQILSEQENIIEQAIQKLEEMKSKYRKETNQIVQAAVSEIEQDIEASDMIKRKSSRNREILEAALKYEDGCCASVLTYLLKNEVGTLNDSLHNIEQNRHFKLIYEGKLDFITDSCLGIVKMQQLDTEVVEHPQNPTAGFEKSSDELLETEITDSSVVEKTMYGTFQSTLKMCNVTDNDVELFDVSALNDRKNCSINGSVVLPDGQVVLIDNENTSIKLLSSDFTDILDVLKLPGRPIRICAISSSTVAVSFECVKRINRYTVNGNTLSYDGGFATELFNHGIAFDGSNIVTIASDVDFTSNNNSKTDIIQIEVRNAYDGSVIDVIEEFKVVGNRCRSLFLRNTNGLCFAEDGSMIVAELNRVLRFVLTKESSETVAVEQNYYVCSGEIEKNSIENVTSDGDSVYVCTISGSVLQLSITDFEINRVIITDSGRSMKSITVDNNNNRIILGCCDDDDIYVYSFTRKHCVI